MRRAVLLVWLMLPVLVGFYHAGPGQERALLDEISQTLALAERHVALGEWDGAERSYASALERLPVEQVGTNRRLRLERAKAQMQNHQLPVAHQELKVLVDELKGDAAADPQLLAESRAALGHSQYYMTWLMRLEGQPKERWEPEIEAARQTFRLLAEQSRRAGDLSLEERNREDLEATIRLARMDLSDLQGLPLPSQ